MRALFVVKTINGKIYYTYIEKEKTKTVQHTLFL